LRPAVLHLIDSFNQGGSERQALQLTRLLSQSGRYKVRMACLSPAGTLRSTIDDLDLGDIPSFPLTSFYNQNAVRQLKRFVRWLQTSGIDIVHTHDFYTNVFGMAGGSVARVSVRVASMRETAEMRSLAQKQVQKVAYSLAHSVVANSKAVADKLISDGIRPDKVSVIYNGLDLKRLETSVTRSEALSMLGVNVDEARPVRFVSIVANMRHEVKDYPMFLRAARKVKQAVPDAIFLLAGEGELEESLKSLARELGIYEATVFLGRCENVAELLSISDACVLSSKAEGFSNSILEYMAAGKPVVATNVGGAGEAITEGETGFLVPSGDDEMMAERLASLLLEPDKALKMGAAAKRVVSEGFSCEAQLSRTEHLYETLLRARHR
jgi:glycosyltransferase involved in cell wall biosynthesis